MLVGSRGISSCGTNAGKVGKRRLLYVGLWLIFVPLILGIMRWEKSWREEKRTRGEVDAEDERVEDSIRVQMVNKDNSDHMSERKAWQSVYFRNFQTN